MNRNLCFLENNEFKDPTFKFQLLSSYLIRFVVVLLSLTLPQVESRGQ
jgi:hypothetical protein